MKYLPYISFVGLALSILPSILYAAGVFETIKTHYAITAIGMFMWFGTAIFWIKPGKEL